jgi:Xaa-Pro aminopeptidase
MILSNEPGYYKAGSYGIRIENLIVVRQAPEISGGDTRDMLDFETLTFVPIDRDLINADELAPWERDWLDGYHAQVWDVISPRVSASARDWLRLSTAAL